MKVKLGCLCLFGPGAVFFFLVTKPGRSEPGAHFFLLVTEPGRVGPGGVFFVLLGILSQLRGVPCDGEKLVLVYTSFLVSPFSLR